LSGALFLLAFRPIARTALHPSRSSNPWHLRLSQFSPFAAPHPDPSPAPPAQDDSKKKMTLLSTNKNHVTREKVA